MTEKLPLKTSKLDHTYVRKETFEGRCDLVDERCKNEAKDFRAFRDEQREINHELKDGQSHLNKMVTGTLVFVIITLVTLVVDLIKSGLL